MSTKFDGRNRWLLTGVLCGAPLGLLLALPFGLWLAWPRPLPNGAPGKFEDAAVVIACCPGFLLGGVLGFWLMQMRTTLPAVRNRMLLLFAGGAALGLAAGIAVGIMVYVNATPRDMTSGEAWRASIFFAWLGSCGGSGAAAIAGLVFAQETEGAGLAELTCPLRPLREQVTIEIERKFGSLGERRLAMIRRWRRARLLDALRDLPAATRLNDLF